MERKAFIEKKDREVLIYIENVASGERELMATYDLDKSQMKLLDVERYFHVLRHEESLHLILGHMEEKGWITPKGDSEPQSDKDQDPAVEEKVDDKVSVSWLVTKGVLVGLMDSAKFLEGFSATHLELVPYIKEEGSYLISTTSVKSRGGLEEATSLTLMSPSMKQSLEAITGLNKDELNQFVLTNIKVKVGEPLTAESSILDLKDTSTFTGFKRAVSELRKRLK